MNGAPNNPTPETPSPAEPAQKPRWLRFLAIGSTPPKHPGILAGLQIRKKLLLLHTLFSLALAAILITALRPAVSQIVSRAEANKADLVLNMQLAPEMVETPSAERSARIAMRGDFDAGQVKLRSGTAEELGLTATAASLLRSKLGEPRTVRVGGTATARAAAIDTDRFLVSEVILPDVRQAVTNLYLLLTGALLVIYGLIVVAIEVLVLPRHVYGPIRTMLRADRAVQDRDTDRELIPTEQIPADEIGSIMRSRNAAILALRTKEAAAATTRDQLEHVAADLKRKNHLLETARRNLEDADRLASLGTMSAGIAHELNTPLAVAKGLVDRLAADPAKGLQPAEAALLARVIARLERLGESLLDFARARPPESRPTDMWGVIEEAVTLVRLDRGPRNIGIVNGVPRDLVINCDADRMIQVFVNLIRNAVDVLCAHRKADPKAASDRVTIDADPEHRDGRLWASLRVTDNGPGIDPAMLPTLFDPFVSSHLDARGTGLGLAVAEGIVREHTGVLIARNRSDARGATFEVLLPGVIDNNALQDGDPAATPAPGDPQSQTDRNSATLGETAPPDPERRPSEPAPPRNHR
ncbi:MAG: HAMP domain-containing sensor histidine kinase [Planctomycetota bacterium]